MATERMIIWQGKSPVDGTEIVVLATGVPKAPRIRKDGTPFASTAKSSANEKTGDMIQVWIMVDGMLPDEAKKLDLDAAICGECPHRLNKTCYVNTAKGPRSMMKSHMEKGSVPFDVSRFAGHKVRFGAYGDPAMVPFEVWAPILEVAAGSTGYTHQWKDCDPRFSKMLRASADTVEERREARLNGWKTFRVMPSGGARLEGEISCPASAEAGKKTTCSTCMLCGGTDNGRKKDVVIEVHGIMKNKFNLLAQV